MHCSFVMIKVIANLYAICFTTAKSRAKIRKVIQPIRSGSPMFAYRIFYQNMNQEIQFNIHDQLFEDALLMELRG